MGSLCIVPTTYADQSTTQEQVLSFIENVLPVDLSKYNTTFVSYSILENSTVAGASRLSNNRVIETIKYTLTSDESTVDIICNVENNIVRSCHIYAMKGSIISDKYYTDSFDAVKNFLTTYQTFSKIDSTNLITMLDDVDITKNTTTIKDNVKFAITNNRFSEEELTRFEWTYTVNGADYAKLQVVFQKNGIFDSFRDTRAVYTIGDTSINISKNQAIEIAIKNLSDYSYLMPDESIVRDFNVTKENISAELVTTFVDSELRPYWDIRMPLNQTYPGNVQGIAAFVWANTGEIISYGNIAFGGAYYDGNSNLEVSPSLEVTQNIPTTLDAGFVIVLAIAVIYLIIALVVIIKKKKR